MMVYDKLYLILIDQFCLSVEVVWFYVECYLVVELGSVEQIIMVVVFIVFFDDFGCLVWLVIVKVLVVSIFVFFYVI